MIIKLFYERFRHSDTDKRGPVGPWPSAHVNYNLYFQTSQNGLKCTLYIALSVNGKAVKATVRKDYIMVNVWI